MVSAGVVVSEGQSWDSGKGSAGIWVRAEVVVRGKGLVDLRAGWE